MPDIAPAAMADSRDYRRKFDESRTACQKAMRDGNTCRDYYDDKQLSAAMKRKLRDRGQPETIRNRIKPAVNGWLGVLEQNKVDPRAYPRNPPQEKGADVASKVLRYVADRVRFHKLKIDVADNHLVEGWGAAVIELVEGKPDVRRIRAEEFFYDPRSREADYSDASWLGIGKWMNSDDVAAIYPQFAQDIATATTLGGDSLAFTSQDEDRPSNVTSWVDRKARRIFVVEMYERVASEWSRAVFFSGGVLEEGPSKYHDDEGRTRCPIEASSCFIDRDNRRYGMVQSFISLQDELNARASRLLHLANTRQLQLNNADFAGATDADTARREASRADGVIPEGYVIAPTSDMQAGNAQILAEVTNEIDRQAPTPANLGRADANDSSGRSRLVLQQAGMTEQARALGRLEDWENRVFRSIWLVCKEFMDQPWWIRVAGDDKALQFVQVNEPKYQMRPVQNPDGSPAINPQTGEPLTEIVMQPGPPQTGPDGQPQLGPDGQPVPGPPQPVIIGYKNRLAEMDMDIVVDTVPDTANLQIETFQQLLAETAYGIQAYGAKAWFDTLMTFNPIANKAEVKEILERGAEQVQQQQQAAQQGAAQAQQQKDARDNAKTGADVNLKGATAQHQIALAELATHETHGQHIQNALDVAEGMHPQPPQSFAPPIAPKPSAPLPGPQQSAGF